jgi:nucleoside-diphosphate-sugar epimerase
VEGTRRLVDACIAEQVECVVVLSTMYVFGHPDGLVDEQSPYNPIGGSYGSAKAEMERWCLERANTSGRTRIVVVIPTCVYGPGGDTYTKLPVALAREGRFCWIENGRGLANVVYVDSLVDAIVRAAVTPAAHGQRFIVNDESLTWREFLTPLLGRWAENVTAPNAEEFARMTSVKAQHATVRDVAASVLRSPEVWNTVSRTRVANQLRPLVKKYVPAVGRMKSRAGTKVDVPQAAVLEPPPSWLPEVFGPTTARFSSSHATSVLDWSPTATRDAAAADSVRWLDHQKLYEPPR